MNKNHPKIISIDRASKSWAVFDDTFNLVKDFAPYADETEALAEAKAWFAEQSDEEPEIKYPRITSMRSTLEWT